MCPCIRLLPIPLLSCANTESTSLTTSSLYNISNINCWLPMSLYYLVVSFQKLPGIHSVVHDLRSFVTSSSFGAIPTEFASYLQTLLIDNYVNSLNRVHQQLLLKNRSLFDQWICITASLPCAVDTTVDNVGTSTDRVVLTSPDTRFVPTKIRQQQFRQSIPEFDMWISDKTFSSAITNFTTRFHCTNGSNDVCKRDKLRYHRQGDQLQTYFCPCSTKDTFCFQLRHNQHTDVHVKYGIRMFRFRCYATTDRATDLLTHFRPAFATKEVHHPSTTALPATTAKPSPTTVTTMKHTIERATTSVSKRQKCQTPALQTYCSKTNSSHSSYDTDSTNNACNIVLDEIPTFMTPCNTSHYDIIENSSICRKDNYSHINITQSPASTTIKQPSTNITTINSGKEKGSYGRDYCAVIRGALYLQKGYIAATRNASTIALPSVVTKQNIKNYIFCKMMAPYVLGLQLGFFHVRLPSVLTKKDSGLMEFEPASTVEQEVPQCPICHHFFQTGDNAVYNTKCEIPHFLCQACMYNFCWQLPTTTTFKKGNKVARCADWCPYCRTKGEFLQVTLSTDTGWITTGKNACVLGPATVIGIHQRDNEICCGIISRSLMTAIERVERTVPEPSTQVDKRRYQTYMNISSDRFYCVLCHRHCSNMNCCAVRNCLATCGLQMCIACCARQILLCNPDPADFGFQVGWLKCKWCKQEGPAWHPLFKKYWSRNSDTLLPE